jgi:hypothetical protein
MINQRRFIAIRELWAVETVRPDFTGQVLLIDIDEFLSFEKIRPVGKAENVFDAEIFRFPKAGSYQFSAQAFILSILGHSHRPDFREVRPADMQGGASEDIITIPDYKKVADAFVYFT